MLRFCALVMLLIVIVAESDVFGDDALFERIRKAKDAHDRGGNALRDELVTRLKRAEDTARQTGNKALIDRIKGEADLLESRGTTPSVISTKDYLRKLHKSRESLEQVYVDAIKALVKAGMDDEAETLDKELVEFQVKEKVFYGKHYEVVKSQATWHEARVACERVGGHLAIVKSEAENRYLIALLHASGANNARIGATDEKREGNWAWTDGTRVTYSNWDKQNRQPNGRSSWGQPEHYAAIFLEHNGMWWDVPDSPGEAFICQWD